MKTSPGRQRGFNRSGRNNDTVIRKAVNEQELTGRRDVNMSLPEGQYMWRTLHFGGRKIQSVLTKDTDLLSERKLKYSMQWVVASLFLRPDQKYMKVFRTISSGLPHNIRSSLADHLTVTKKSNTKILTHLLQACSIRLFLLSALMYGKIDARNVTS